MGRRSAAAPPASGPATPPTPVVEPAALAAAPAVAADPLPSPSPRHQTIRTESVIESLGFEEPRMRSLASTTAEDYRRRARFPRSSQPIEDGVDPVARDREVTPGRSLGPEGHDPTLVAYPARTSFEAPGAVLIHAYLVQDERRVDARALRGEVRTQEGGTLAVLAFRDDGVGGDAEANDLLFTARLAPPPEEARAFKGANLVEVRAETLKGEERVATTGFLLQRPADG